MRKQQAKVGTKTPTRNKLTKRTTSKVTKRKSPLKTIRRNRSAPVNYAQQQQQTQQIPTTTLGQGFRPLRVAHLTDLHYFSKTPPTISQLLSKRIAGYANLVLFKRRRHFDDQARHNTIQQIDQMAPDLIVCSGDLTSTGLDLEFDEAFQSLKPLMDKYPFFLTHGNHDVYTKQNEQQMSLAQRFSNYMHSIFPKKLQQLQSAAPATQPKSTTATHSITKDLNKDSILSTTNDNLVSPELQQKFPALSFFLTRGSGKAKTGGSGPSEPYSLIIGLNPCRADNLSSTGEYPEDQLQQLAELLNQDESTSLLFVDHKTSNRVKPFIILVTHYPVVDRRGADYTAVHKRHGATNNHRLLSVLDNAFIKPGLILHGHDHLGAATGIVTQRMTNKLTDLGNVLNPTQPQPVKTYVHGDTLVNLDSTENLKWKFDPKTGEPIVNWEIPTVKDITHAYTNTYTPETNQKLQKHLVDNLIQQHDAHRARDNYRLSSFKELDLVSGLFQWEQRYTMNHQHGNYFHTSAPLRLKQYLTNGLKPFGPSTYIPKSYKQGAPQFSDDVSKLAQADRLKKKEKQLTEYYAQHPQHKNPHVTIQEEAEDLARREERETCVVDISKQTDFSPNLVTDVVIPIHNPGSGALSGRPARNELDWPKFASFNIYQLTPRHVPIPKSKDSGQGYVTSDFYSLGVQHHMQNQKLAFPKTGSEEATPYTFPFRP